MYSIGCRTGRAQNEREKIDNRKDETERVGVYGGDDVDQRASISTSWTKKFVILHPACLSGGSSECF